MIEIMQTDAGVPTARLNGKFLHSPRDPMSEARRATEKIARREPACVIVLGFGLGYQTEALLETTESSHFVVFEPDAVLTAQLRDARDVTDILASDRVSWCETTTELEERLIKHAASGFEVVSLRARRDADPPQFDQADRVIEAFRSRVEINSNTLVRFGRLWVRNLCRNIDSLAAGVPVSRLTGLFEGLPGVLLAAGPGLDQILHILPELSKRMVVVAVDTAVRACRDCGVQPDLAVVVDPQYWNARHLDSVYPSSTIVVGESSTHPSVFSHFRTPPLFCSSLFPLGADLEVAVGPMGTLGAGGSVSTTAWDLLRLLGCAPIYVAGLDLGFPGGRTHFRGSFFENLALALGTRLLPAEKTIYGYLSSADPHLVEAANGPPVLTDRRMEIYRRWFASKAGDHSSPDTFTITSGGVLIEGVLYVDGESLTSLPVARAAIDAQISAIGPLTHDAYVARTASIRTRLVALLSQLRPLEVVVKRALEAVTEIEMEVGAGARADFSRLTSLDLEIQRCSGRSVVGFLIQEAIARIGAGFGSGSIAEQVSASRELYSGLLDSVRFHKVSIQDALEGRGQG